MGIFWNGFTEWMTSQPFQDWLLSDSPPTWLALGAATTAALYARNEHRRATQRDLEGQASQVAVWPNKSDDGVASFGILNSSRGPVYSITVRAYSWTNPRTANRTATSFDIGVMPPLAEARYFRTGLPMTGDGFSFGYNYAVEFRDAQNNYWHRTRNGELHNGKLPVEADLTVRLLPAGQGQGSPFARLETDSQTPKQTVPKWALLKAFMQDG